MNNHGLSPIILDDQFVLDQLRPPSRLPALVSPPLRPHVYNRRINGLIERSLDLLGAHYGFGGLHSAPSAFDLHRTILTLTLKTLGKVLILEKSILDFEKLIGVDWISHVKLDKEKRYRDHIIHPARVTAIGWWLLHRDGESLLRHLSSYYEESTRDYRSLFGIDTAGHEWKALVEYAWLACGLLHDSSYSMEYHLRLGESLRRGKRNAFGSMIPAVDILSSSPRRQTFLAPLENTWFAGQAPELEHRLEGLCKPGKGKKFKGAHPVLGSLNLLLSLNRAQIHSLQGLVAQLAARAILTHHDEHDDHLLSDPMSLLLFVADGLQAWGRPFLDAEKRDGILNPYKTRLIIECSRIRLDPLGTGYVARFHMNEDPEYMEILKYPPYQWTFDSFSKPNKRLEQLICASGLYPSIVLTERDCVRPNRFLDFMEAPRSAP